MAFTYTLDLTVRVPRRGTQLRYSFTVLTTFASFTRKKMNRTAGANLTRLFFETFLTEKQTRKNPSLPNYPKEDNPPNSLPTILLRVLQHSKRTWIYEIELNQHSIITLTDLENNGRAILKAQATSPQGATPFFVWPDQVVINQRLVYTPHCPSKRKLFNLSNADNMLEN